MRINDSTKTRVTPAFDQISKPENFKHFINFLNAESEVGRVKHKLPIEAVLKEICYDSGDGKNKEKKKDAPVPFLKVLMNGKDLIDWRALGKIKNKAIREARRKLKQAQEKGAEDVIAKAIANIGKDKTYLFEGKTSPDVCIRTDSYYLLIEGKLTEPKLTRRTQWVKNRDQLIRHIDAFLDNRDGNGGKPLKVYGLYIISGAMKEKYKNQLADYENDSKYKEWMPHRAGSAKEIMQKSYLGYVTWEDLEQFFRQRGIGLNYINPC